MADTDLTPYDMGTFGSRTTPLMAPQIKRSARPRVNRSSIRRRQMEGRSLVYCGRSGRRQDTIPPANQSFALASLLVARILLKTDRRPPPSPSRRMETRRHVQFRKGECHRHRDRCASLHARFHSARHAATARICVPPASTPNFTSFDAKEASAIPGVTIVRDGDFTGAVAPDENDAR